MPAEGDTVDAIEAIEDVLADVACVEDILADIGDALEALRARLSNSHSMVSGSSRLQGRLFQTITPSGSAL